MNRYPSEFTSRKIGIITPYRSQLFLLRSRFTSCFGPEIVAEMEINTVDGFQGREVDILLLSTVRASMSSGSRHQIGEARSIGFVADVRRMNVALTRARLSLWIVGNARTLQTNSHWDSLVQNAKERNLFISVKRPYGLVFEKVRPQSKDIHGTTRSCHSNHLKKNNEMVAMTRSERKDARVQKEQPTDAFRNVEKQGKGLSTEQSKRTSRWDQKVPKAQESFVRRSSEQDSEKQDGDLRAAKHSVLRKQKAGRRSSEHNDNHLELSKSLVKGSSQEGSTVKRMAELNQPVEQDACTETNKTSVNQDSFQSSNVRIHNKDKKNASQNNDTRTIKDVPKHDSDFKPAGKSDNASPSAHSDLQKLIKKAKGVRKISEKTRSDSSNKQDFSLKHGKDLGQANQTDGPCPPTDTDMKKDDKAKRARKFSEKPRSGNLNQVDPSEKTRSGSSNQVDISLKHGKDLDRANQDDGLSPPKDVGMKIVNKAKRARRFYEKPRSGSSNQMDPSLSSHFDEASSHMPELKKSHASNLAVTSQKLLSATRKRQREDVESLLSAAFIPSKKPSSTCPTNKQK
jgi:hypothetical protein